MHVRQYRDSRAIHLACLRRWKAAMRATSGNPTLQVLASVPPCEVRRDAVAQGIDMARRELAVLRHHPLER